jgi:NAD(P)-dependent dehydrogenase (short-subunit alcohol dehydrogenase family)
MAVSVSEAALGRLDILVSNAGIARDALALRLRNEDWQAVLDLNLTADRRDYGEDEALRASVASADAARAMHAVLEASPQGSDARMIGEALAGLVRTESEVLSGPKLTTRHREPAKKPQGHRRVSVEAALPRR